ncbi:DoxX family protein [Flavobacterium agrisoli]|uniref:DoxX family protein n=1 Tax=Flavobacterium agrisoli TaxID=2793066 RepID=A0A934PI38_9FLAO|nr:DoxX family protein [Flavobacterium agrisoli]MBK0368472.1 DoxX family protein [Flavobacterium agrisoli]
MESVKKMNKWANSHTYFSLDLFRIVFGVFLFMKGISFVSNAHYLQELISPIDRFGGGMFLLHYIAPAHMIGGIMIAFGLLTRWATAAQIPILLGAVFVNILGTRTSEHLIVALIALLVCIFFFVYGSGKHSADYYFKMNQ